MNIKVCCKNLQENQKVAMFLDKENVFYFDLQSKNNLNSKKNIKLKSENKKLIKDNEFLMSECKKRENTISYYDSLIQKKQNELIELNKVIHSIIESKRIVEKEVQND